MHLAGVTLNLRGGIQISLTPSGGKGDAFNAFVSGDVLAFFEWKRTRSKRSLDLELMVVKRVRMCKQLLYFVQPTS